MQSGGSAMHKSPALKILNCLLNDIRMPIVTLASRMGVARQTIYNWRDRVNRPSPKHEKRLTLVLAHARREEDERHRPQGRLKARQPKFVPADIGIPHLAEDAEAPRVYTIKELKSMSEEKLDELFELV